MFKLLSFLAGSVAVGMLVACGGGGDKPKLDADVDGPAPLGPPASLAIAGASSLIMAPLPASARTTQPHAPTRYTLERVNADGTVGTVTITDANGADATSSAQVMSMVDGGAFVAIQFEIVNDTGALTFQPIVIVRKSDGVAFDLSPAIGALGCMNLLKQYDGSPFELAFTDAQGGAYLAFPCGSTYAGNLVRIDTTASPPTATFALPSDTHLWDYAVDPAGNIAYVAAQGGSPGIWRARSAAGQTKNLPQFSDPFTGPDDQIHFIGGTLDTCASAEGCTSDLVVNGSNIDVVLGAQGGALPNLGAFARLPIGSDVFFVSPHSQMGFAGPLTISRWQAAQATPYATQWPDHTLRAAAASSTHVFIAALDTLQNPVLARFAASDLAAGPTQVIADGQYDIAKLRAAADGTLTFAGLRLSDSKEVVGQISPSGTVTISSEYVAPVGSLVPL